MFTISYMKLWAHLQIKIILFYCRKPFIIIAVAASIVLLCRFPARTACAANLRTGLWLFVQKIGITGGNNSKARLWHFFLYHAKRTFGFEVQTLYFAQVPDTLTAQLGKQLFYR